MHRTADLNDTELISLFLEGHADAFDVLVHRYEQALHGFLLQLVQDEELANDLFQDTFLRIMRALPTYNEQGKFPSWLMGIARNLALDAIRRRGFENNLFKRNRVTKDDEDPRDTIAEIPDGGESPADAAERAEWFSRMRAALKELSVEQREIVSLRYDAGLTFHEISDITGVSINTALGRMRYALNALRKRLDLTTEAVTR
jgi:RNA polymerase sigma-70 factor (ECF subfamily)